MTVAFDEARRRDSGSFSQDEVVDALAVQAAALDVGTRLPSESQIMHRYVVSRSVARAAIERLEGCHLVRRVQGTGTFVHRRLDVPVGGVRVPSFHGAIRAAGGSPRTVLISAQDEPFPPAAAVSGVSFGVDRGTDTGTEMASPACKIERIGFIDDEVVGVLEHWLCVDTLPEPAVAVRAYDSVNDALAAGGYDVDCVMRRATTESAPGWVSRRLELPARSEAWVLEAACVDEASGRPLYYMRAWARIDRVRLVFAAS